MNKSVLRRWHRIVSVVIALPLAVVVLTGVLLQWRGKVEALQPSTVPQTKSGAPLLSLEAIIERAGGTVDQVIYRPSKHALAIRLTNGEEVQLHPETGAEIKRGPRRTATLIDWHQGSMLGAWSQYGLYVLTAWGLLFLLLSGLLIFPWKRGQR